MKICIATGGSAGHVIPAQLLYEKAEEEGHKAIITSDKRVSFLFENSNMNLKYIPSASPSKSNLLYTAVRILYGIGQSTWYLKKNQIDSVILFGGYATFPVMIAAKLLRKKIYIHEQNAVLGKVNRIGVKFAKKIFLSFPNSLGLSKKNEEKSVVSGMPTRKLSECCEMPSEIREILDSNSKLKKIIFVIGGSNASLAITNIVSRALAELENKENVLIIQQAPKEIETKLKNLYDKMGFTCHVQNYFENILEIMRHSDLIISRAGASSIFELLQSKTDAILIPSPTSIYNHQYENATRFEDIFKVIEQNNQTQNKLVEAISDILNKSQFDIEALESKKKDFVENNSVDIILQHMSQDLVIK